jgi:hypothetical protein
MQHEINTQRGDYAHAEAAEIHALRRLRQRYGISVEEAPSLYMNHLAHVLAGDGEIRARWKHDARMLIRLHWEGVDYWLVFCPQINRIVTYLTENHKLVRLRGSIGLPLQRSHL